MTAAADKKAEAEAKKAEEAAKATVPAGEKPGDTKPGGVTEAEQDAKSTENIADTSKEDTPTGENSVQDKLNAIYVELTETYEEDILLKTALNQLTQLQTTIAALD